MARPIRVLTINHSTEDRRIRVILVRDDAPDQPTRYRWVDEETGADSEVSALTVAEAMRAAEMSWGNVYGPTPWDLRFGR